MKREIQEHPWSQHCFNRQMRYARWWLAFVFSVLLVANSRAQITTSAVNGTVTDGTGAVVPGASISVVNTATGVEYRATTDGQGSFHVTQLPPGSYTLQVSKTGFQTQNIQAFKLFVDQQFQQNI